MIPKEKQELYNNFFNSICTTLKIAKQLTVTDLEIIQEQFNIVVAQKRIEKLTN